MDNLEEFLIVRHGQAEANIDSLTCGLLDSPLTDLGYQQAHDIGKSLSDLRGLQFGVIAHSPLMRSRETAKVLSTYFPSLELVERIGFNERSFGAWEGRPWADTFEQLKKGVVPPGGEGKDAFVHRIKQETMSIVREVNGVPIIVAHGGTFYGLGCLIKRQSINIENCAAYHFKTNGKAWNIMRIRNGLYSKESPFG